VGRLVAHPVNYRERALRSLGQLPPFSPILNKLLATLASDDVSFASLAELIEKDTVLAGNVLRLVNSALYGRRGTVSSVRHAVSLMGLVKIRNAAMTLSVSRVWNHQHTPPGWSQARFNLHAVAAAILADLIAQRVKVDYPEGGFVAGLLHDIGLMLIAISLPDEFAEILDTHKGGGRQLADCELEVLGLDHAELSAQALFHWNIPEPIQRAVRFHHSCDPPAPPDLRLSHIVQAADSIAERRGLSVLDYSEEAGQDPLVPLTLLGLEPLAEQVLQEFDNEFESIKAFF